MSFHEHEMENADARVDLSDEQLDLVSLLDNQDNNINNNNDNNNNDDNNNQNVNINNEQNIIFRFNLGKVYTISLGLYVVITSIILLACLIVDRDKLCDKYLHTWSIVQIIIQSLHLFTVIVLYINIPIQQLQNIHELSYNRFKFVTAIYFFQRFLNLAWLIWFIVGTALRFGKSSCHATSLLKAISTILIMQWCFIGALVVSFCCTAAGLAILYRRNPNLFGVQRIRGATKEQVKKLKEIKYDPSGSEFHIDDDDANCAICLSPYELRENLRILPCGHHFHSSCVDQWLFKNKSCPFCKRDIDTEYVNKQDTKNEGPDQVIDDDGIDIIIE